MNLSYLNVSEEHSKRNLEEPLVEDEFYYYDATWAVARSLHEVLKVDPTYIETFNYKRNDTKLRLFREKFEQVDFQGATVCDLSFVLSQKDHGGLHLF